MCNTFRHSRGTIQSYMAWNFLPSYLVYILYCVWKVKASKAQAGFRLMLFYKSEINFGLQFKFRIKERRNSTVHHITVSSFLYNWWIIRKPYQCDMVSYWYELFLNDCIEFVVFYHIINKYMIWITRNKSDSCILFNASIEKVWFSLQDFYRSLHLFYSPWNHRVAQFAPLRLCNLIS